MKNSDTKEMLDFTFEKIYESKYLKTTSIVFLGILGIYVLGHLFKITAHTVNGLNELRNAIKNG